MKTVDDLLAGGNAKRGKKRVLMRADLNVPMTPDGDPSDDTRLRRILPTLNRLQEAGCRIGLLSHFGRPKGKPDPKHSLQPLAPALAKLAKTPVAFLGDCADPQSGKNLAALPPGGIGLFENTRFHPGETANAPDFAHRLAANGDLYINDAFSASHRDHASITGLPRLLPTYVGDAMLAEITALETHLAAPKPPTVAIVGGAKLSTKLSLLRALIQRFDTLILGGGMANQLLAAHGVPIGDSLHEPERLDEARALIDLAQTHACALILPRDVVLARESFPHAPHRVLALQPPGESIAAGEMILDIGEESRRNMAAYLESASTLVWNGPLGVFETPPFAQGGEETARHVAMLTRIGQLVSVAGGGETAMLLEQAGASRDFSHVSTGGGAFLAWLETGDLIGLEAARAAAGATTTSEGKNEGRVG